MRVLPPNVALALPLLSRAVPPVTRRKTVSPTRSDNVLAIWSGATPNAAAASATVAVLSAASMTAMSGALAAKNWRTASMLMSFPSFARYSPPPVFAADPRLAQKILLNRSAGRRDQCSPALAAISHFRQEKTYDDPFY